MPRRPLHYDRRQQFFAYYKNPKLPLLGGLVLPVEATLRTFPTGPPRFHQRFPLPCQKIAGIM